MKFETPKMNISMFATENVVTTASGATSPMTVEEARKALTTAGVTSEENIYQFVF